MTPGGDGTNAACEHHPCGGFDDRPRRIVGHRTGGRVEPERGHRITELHKLANEHTADGVIAFFGVSDDCGTFSLAPKASDGPLLDERECPGGNVVGDVLVDAAPDGGRDAFERNCAVPLC